MASQLRTYPPLSRGSALALPRGRVTASAAALAGLCALLTAIVTATPALRFAYQAAELQVALDTTASLSAALAALLVFGRYRASGREADLVLAAGFALLAAVNLVFATGADVAGLDDGSFSSDWAAMGGRVLAGGLLALAAFWPSRSPDAGVSARARRLVAVALATSLGVMVALGATMPGVVDPGLTPDRSRGIVLSDSGAALVMQVLSILFYALAAAGFARRADRTGDRFFAWLAPALVLALFARVNYLLFPSLYTEWLYTGDFLRLGFHVLVLVGAAREIMAVQRDDARSSERRAVARDLHDGLAQELAFIRATVHRLAHGDPTDPRLRKLDSAAQRALDEARSAIRTLTAADDEPLDVALAAAAEDAGGRSGLHVVLDLQPVDVPAVFREALRRVVQEAVTNAARHGAADTVAVELAAGARLHLAVRDDGRGFDAEAPRRRDAFGLTSMRERVEALGGTFAIRSVAGSGTIVEVDLPWPMR